MLQKMIEILAQKERQRFGQLELGLALHILRQTSTYEFGELFFVEKEG